MDEEHSHASVDYESIPNRSNWGEEEAPVVEAINKVVDGGIWLNLAAGDGRFNNNLLARAAKVIAADNDERALNKLLRLAPVELKNRLEIEIFNITAPLPYPDSCFDGCFCTATLYIFEPASVKFMVSEIIRVGRPGSAIIVDFRTDIRRVLPDGTLYIYPEEYSYNMCEGRTLIEQCFAGQSYEISRYEKLPAPRTIGTISYIYESQCLLITARVKK